MRGKFRNRTARLTAATLLLSLIPALVITTPSSATVSTTVASVYVDAPFVQGSYARHHGGVTEDFNGLATGAITSNSHSIVGGTKTSGQFTVSNASSVFGATTTSETATVGGSGTKYASTNDSTGFQITFSTPVKYIGFRWSAGNNDNNVKFFSGSTEIASFSTTNLRTLLGNPPNNDAEYAAATDSITATNGTRYPKKYYFGPPAGYTTETPTTLSSIQDNSRWESYAYVHTFAREDESFDRLQIYGAGFEFDNLTVSTQEVPIRTSLVLVNNVTTNLTLGESRWNFKGVTTTDSTTVSTGWVSDSSTVVRSTRISIAQDLSISSGTITMGRTALFRTAITNAASNTCGTTFTLIDSYTATDEVYRDITLVDNGTATRDRLIRGFCYKWTLDPSSSLGTGAVRPTSDGVGTRFNSNLESPMIIIPETAVESCAGIGSLVNGNFETLPSPDSITVQASSTSGPPPDPAVGMWHGYGSSGNPKQYLFLFGNNFPGSSNFELNGWRTTAGGDDGDGLIEIQRVDGTAVRTNGILSGQPNYQSPDEVGIRSARGSFHAELAATALSALYQDVGSIPGTTIRWSVKHRARIPGAIDSMQVQIGSTANPVAQTVTQWRGPSNSDVYAVPSFSGAFTETSTTTIRTSLTQGWTEYRGSYVVPAGQTTTRFRFEATGGSSAQGNLLDDIEFSPLVACPTTVTVTRSSTTTINPFDIDGDGNGNGTENGDSYGWANAFVADSLTVSAGTATRISADGTANRAIRYRAPSATGTYTLAFALTNPEGDRSISTITINVISGVTASCLAVGALINGSFEESGPQTDNRRGGSYSAINPEDTDIPSGWRTTALDSGGGRAVIETWRDLSESATARSMSGPSSAYSFHGSVIAEIAADSSGGANQGLYQDVSTSTTARVFWSYRHAFRSGQNIDTQTSIFQAGPTPSGTPTNLSSVWTQTQQDNPFGSGVTPTISVSDVVTASTDGWVLSSGTFLPTSTATRFLFRNGTASQNVGNLIDDVRFTSYSACPLSVSIIAGRTSNFLIQNNEQNPNNFKYYAPSNAVISEIFDTENELTATIGTTNDTGSTIQLSASDVGTYDSTYQVSYEFNGSVYTTSASLTVEVLPEVTAKVPAVVPFDPTLKVKSLAGIRFATATNAYVCINQVANRSGETLTPTTVSITQGALVSGAFLVSSGATLIDSGTVGALTNQARLIRITSNSGVLGRGGSKFLRVRASSIDNTDGEAPSCDNGISFVIEFKTIKMTQTRRYVVPLKNGRQSG